MMATIMPRPVGLRTMGNFPRCAQGGDNGVDGVDPTLATLGALGRVAGRMHCGGHFSTRLRTSVVEPHARCDLPGSRLSTVSTTPTTTTNLLSLNPSTQNSRTQR
jgi:hypothetical protein